MTVGIPTTSSPETFEWAVDFAQLLDTLGYDEFWMAEHHFQPEGYECIPNLLMLNVYLATKTARLKFGCGFNITPMWHPLRLAEDFAMADILTQGRVIFGVGRGYHTREVETFGAPMRDANANRELFEEQIAVLLKAFHEESFAHDGRRLITSRHGCHTGATGWKHSPWYPGPSVVPWPSGRPLVSGTQRGIDFMARMGIKALVANTPEPTFAASGWGCTRRPQQRTVAHCTWGRIRPWAIGFSSPTPSRRQ